MSETLCYNNPMEKIITGGKKILAVCALFLAACLLLSSCDAYLARSYPSPLDTDATEKPTADPDSVKKFKDFEYTDNGETAVIYSYRGGSKEVEVPAEIAGMPVIGIRTEAFKGKVNVVSVNVGAAVTIGKNAFAGCSSLASVTLPEGTESIGVSAFEGCISLASVTLPQSLRVIGDRAFYGCTSFTQADIAAVTSLGAQAFEGCTALASVYLPSLERIGASAFKGCTALATAALDGTANELPAELFSGCSSLVSVGLPAGTESLGRSVFHECSSLLGVTLPDGVSTVGTACFDGCTSLSAITLPQGINSLPERAFNNCTALEEISLPESVTSIGMSAFGGCTSLKRAELPRVRIIEGSAFSRCTSLKEVIYPHDPEKDRNISLTEIGTNAFSECAALESFPLPESVTTLGDGAFRGCESLTEAVIPTAVGVIPGYLFDGCKNLGSVTIKSEKLVTIGPKAFADCESLNTVGIPDTVTIIGKNAFENCSFLFGIGIPDAAITIGSDILAGTEGTVVGFNEDKEMVAQADAGIEVDLNSYARPELGHMVFYFDYRTKYHLIALDMWRSLSAALPKECPECGSTKIRLSGRTMLALSYEFAAENTLDATFICFSPHCGKSFTHTLTKGEG